MNYKEIECPTCGNPVRAKEVEYRQKCPHCKQLYVVEVFHKANSRKTVWTVEHAEFDIANSRRPPRERGGKHGAHH